MTEKKFKISGWLCPPLIRILSKAHPSFSLRPFILSFIVLYLLSGCSNYLINPPTVTPRWYFKPTATVTPRLPTPTRFQTTTVTPQPESASLSPADALSALAGPISLETPLPDPQIPFSASAFDANKPKLIARWGEGNIKSFYLDEAANTLNVLSSLGVYHFDLATLRLVKTEQKVLGNRSLLISNNAALLIDADDRFLELFNIDGSLKFTFPAQVSSIIKVTLSADGSLAATYSRDKLIRVFATATGVQSSTLAESFEVVEDMAFFPDNSALIVAGSGNTLRLFNPNDGSLSGKLSSNLSYNRMILPSPQSDQIACAYGDVIRLYTYPKGKFMASLQIPSSQITAMAFSPDSSLFAAAAKDGSVFIWDLKTSRKIRSLASESVITKILFSGDLKYLIGQTQDDTLHLWDIQETLTLRSITNFRPPVFELSYLPQIDRLASASSTDPSVKIINPSTGIIDRSISSYLPSLAAFAAAADGSALILGTTDHALRIYNPQDGSLLRTLLYRDADDLTITIAHDSSAYATLSRKGNLDFYRFKDGYQTYTTKTVPSMSMLFFPDDNGLFIGSASGSLLYVDKPGRSIRSISAHTDLIWRLLLSTDHKLLASASADGTASVWKLPEAEAFDPTLLQRAISVQCGSPVRALALSPDSSILVTASENNSLNFWRIADAKSLATITRLSDTIQALAFSADGTALYGGSSGGWTAVWYLTP